jgi:hypothetical protein
MKAAAQTRKTLLQKERRAARTHGAADAERLKASAARQRLRKALAPADAWTQGLHAAAARQRLRKALPPAGARAQRARNTAREKLRRNTQYKRGWNTAVAFDQATIAATLSPQQVCVRTCTAHAINFVTVGLCAGELQTGCDCGGNGRLHCTCTCLGGWCGWH